MPVKRKWRLSHCSGDSVADFLASIFFITPDLQLCKPSHEMSDFIKAEVNGQERIKLAKRVLAFAF